MEKVESYDQLIGEARQILTDLGYSRSSVVPLAAALTLIAFAGLKPGQSWELSSNDRLTTRKGVMERIAQVGKSYAENSRETVRKQGINALMAMGLVEKNPDDPTLPQNSSLTHYALTKDALDAIRRFGSNAWIRYADRLRAAAPNRSAVQNRRRSRLGTIITLPTGKVLQLSPGSHGLIIAAVVEDFMQTFIRDAELLYVSDTSNKQMWVNAEKAKQLRVNIDPAKKLPDVIAHDPALNALVLIEVVDSGGAMTDQRVAELDKLFRTRDRGLAFVTAFSTFADFRKFLSEIAWDTDVWIVEEPDHMIHYNGHKFISHR